MSLMKMQFKRGGGGKGWWLYAPCSATNYFGADGWVALHWHWLWEKWCDERARRRRVAAAVPSDTQRLDWWFACGMDDSVCDGSVDLWWADEQDGDAVVRVTHGTSVRDTLDKAMRGIYDGAA